MMGAMKKGCGGETRRPTPPPWQDYRDSTLRVTFPYPAFFIAQWKTGVR